jgi:hypothetical protein
MQDAFGNTLATQTVPEPGKCSAYRLRRPRRIDGTGESVSACGRDTPPGVAICQSCAAGESSPHDMPLYF